MKPIIFIISVLIIFSSCGTKKPADADALPNAITDSIITLTEVQLKNAGITTGQAATRSISSILKVNGKIDVPPQNMVSISVPLGGYLKTTKLLPGMHVSKGEVIAVVEDQQYIQLQQDYLTAQAKIGSLENEYKRQQALNQSQASSDKVYQLAEAEYKTQRILITSLAQKLQLAGINMARLNEATISRSVNIYSPINGYVSKVNVNIGKYVSPTDVLFELINPQDIHLAIKVFERDLDKLFIGQKLTAYTNNDPQKKHPCEILLIGKDLSMEGNTDVHCHFEDYDKTLVPGTYMNAEIEIKNKNALVVPEQAVLGYAKKQYVFIKSGQQRFAMVPVTTGEVENGFIEIIVPANLTKQEFVFTGAYSLLMGLKNTSGD
jgi:cobalt-zinc-cadmium efflux system membrane fusion protein